MIARCLLCKEPLKGRKDKKFCNPQCKSAYQYQKLQEGTPDFFYRVDRQLKKNRRLLKAYNKAGKATVRASTIIGEGFNPNIFTHYWKNKKGDVYLFVYEYGFLRRQEGQAAKYVLVKWQPYMKLGLL